MLQFSNKTPFINELIILPDKDGIDSAVAIIKATFDILPDKIKVSEKQLPIIKADEYWGNPDDTSLKYASENSLPKPGTDIVLIGHAYSPNGKPTKSEDVALKVGQYYKVLRIFGDRYWNSSVGINTITAPEPFTKMPLVYERAFGGYDSNGSGKKIGYEPRNPVGTGFRIKKKVDGLKLPNIENPRHIISSVTDRPPPASFGYIAPSWEPRTQFMGTYDNNWLKNRAPYLPEDFDVRFFNCAHPDLVTNTYLTGGEDVIIQNVSPRGTIAFNLPKINLEFFFIIDGNLIISNSCLDTLVIEPDENRFSMIWKACEKCDKKVLKIHNVGVICIESDIKL